MADYDETYSFTTLSGNSADFTWDGPDVDVLSAENTAGSWCWTDVGSTSSNTGPPSGVPCVYTETSSPVAVDDEFYMTLAAANEVDAGAYGIYVTFNTCTYGNTSAHLYFEAWDGGTWQPIDDWAGNSTTTFTSRGPYDFTSYDNSDFSIRFRTLVAGTTYTNDMAVDEIRIYGDSKVSYKLEGVTKNSSGSALGSCHTFLCIDNGDNTASFVAYQLSNASTGAYSFTGLTDNSASYFVIAWKDDSPHVMDTTDHVLQPVEE
jgi:hypothetical protein